MSTHLGSHTYIKYSINVLSFCVGICVGVVHRDMVDHRGSGMEASRYTKTGKIFVYFNFYMLNL